MGMNNNFYTTPSDLKNEKQDTDNLTKQANLVDALFPRSLNIMSAVIGHFIRYTTLVPGCGPPLPLELP